MVGVLNSAAFFGLRKFKFVLPTFLENVIRVTAYKLLHFIYLIIHKVKCLFSKTAS